MTIETKYPGSALSYHPALRALSSNGVVFSTQRETHQCPPPPGPAQTKFAWVEPGRGVSCFARRGVGKSRVTSNPQKALPAVLLYYLPPQTLARNFLQHAPLFRDYTIHTIYYLNIKTEYRCILRLHHPNCDNNNFQKMGFSWNCTFVV